MSNRHQIAYIQRFIYPDLSAAASQTIQMAAALADETQDTSLFVHDLVDSEAGVKAHYGVDGSALRIMPLKTQSWPAWLYNNGKARFILYNSAVALRLGLSTAWRRSAKQKTIFVRSQLERLYWGFFRPYLPGFRRWIFVYEAHDVAGLPPKAALEDDPFALHNGQAALRRRSALKALQRFDLILCVTQALADDLHRWSHGTLRPRVVRHASSLPRLPEPPALRPFGDRVTLGYVGTIDRVRGVDTLIEAMRALPERFVLRLVGRVPEEEKTGRRPAWLEDRLADPAMKAKVELVPPVPLPQVAEEVDRCDIVLQPASDDIISLRYRAPLKLIDYMMRGKPIVAADVPCHRELLCDGVNAVLYRHGDVAHLAERVQALVATPDEAVAVARAAWSQSADHTYAARAKRILALIDEVGEQRQVARSA